MCVRVFYFYEILVRVGKKGVRLFVIFGGSWNYALEFLKAPWLARILFRNVRIVRFESSLCLNNGLGLFNYLYLSGFAFMSFFLRVFAS